MKTRDVEDLIKWEQAWSSAVMFALEAKWPQQRVIRVIRKHKLAITAVRRHPDFAVYVQETLRAIDA